MRTAGIFAPRPDSLVSGFFRLRQFFLEHTGQGLHERSNLGLVQGLGTTRSAMNLPGSRPGSGWKRDFPLNKNADGGAALL